MSDWKRKIGDAISLLAIVFSSFFVIFLLIGIIGYLLVKGIGTINLRFLTTATSVLNGNIGIAGNLINTVLIIILTMILVVPIGIGSAIYLNEYAKNKKFVEIIEFATETLSGIPSIIFGLFGMSLFVEGLGLGNSLLAGALTLFVMVLPLVTRNTQEALKAVQVSYRYGAIGLGSGKWYMIKTILLPCALPGILTGTILAIGKVVAESAALLFTAGSSKLLPAGWNGLLRKPFLPGGTLTIQMYLSATSEGDFETAFGIGLVLLIVVLLINLTTKLLTKLFNKERRG